ncbi:hypothetical protein STA1M1_02140 [Sinisalibacter aestuarii]|uniref:Uncharacterized protein n=1 Tax=Sinisalibacter aestuarii TaxID=2949426 RepID=A0ABQ5LMU5_9RHOB|nr:hypothetical protein STA1M1_02140 [Sinisalibacter aestuarii]
MALKIVVKACQQQHIGPCRSNHGSNGAHLFSAGKNIRQQQAGAAPAKLGIICGNTNRISGQRRPRHRQSERQKGEQAAHHAG